MSRRGGRAIKAGRYWRYPSEKTESAVTETDDRPSDEDISHSRGYKKLSRRTTASSDLMMLVG